MRVEVGLRIDKKSNSRELFEFSEVLAVGIVGVGEWRKESACDRMGPTPPKA